MKQSVFFALVAIALMGPLKADPLDPHFAGLWVESTKTPSFTENLVWMIGLKGEYLDHTQHTPLGGAINIIDRTNDVSVYEGTIATSAGTYTTSFSDNSSSNGAYVLTDDQSRMLVKSDVVPNAFLFVRYGIAKSDGGWDCKSNPKGVPFLVDANVVSNLVASGPVHWVEPGLAGVWIKDAPTAERPSRQTQIWIIQPDGPSTLHVQKVSPTQPMDPNSSAHDTTTLTGLVDIFGGRFCFTSVNGSAHDTGIYTLEGNELRVRFDRGLQVTNVFKRGGDFNLDGSVRLK